MTSLENIFSGYKNLITGEHKELADKRLTICSKCSVRSKGICDPTKKDYSVKTNELTKGCGCVLVAKVRSPRAKCPLDKW